MAVTLPVLSGAHTEALTESSINNLRQIHLLLLSYVEDYNGYWAAGQSNESEPAAARHTPGAATYGSMRTVHSLQISMVTRM